MRILVAATIGITAAQAGFGAGMVGTILVGPWSGTTFPALTAGYAMGTIAMLGSFGFALRALGRRVTSESAPRGQSTVWTGR